MPSTDVLSVRVSREEREKLQFAAEQSRSTVSDFMRRKALEAADMELIDRRIITLSEEAWNAFDAAMKAPAEEIPALRELFQRTPIWSK